MSTLRTYGIRMRRSGGSGGHSSRVTRSVTLAGGRRRIRSITSSPIEATATCSGISPTGKPYVANVTTARRRRANDSGGGGFFDGGVFQRDGYSPLLARARTRRTSSPPVSILQPSSVPASVADGLRAAVLAALSNRGRRRGKGGLQIIPKRSRSARRSNFCAPGMKTAAVKPVRNQWFSRSNAPKWPYYVVLGLKPVV